ncbi:MAG: tRNA pseudouridine(13) synthase TruD [Candidatus Bathyarchaeia archaeon]
MRCIRSSYELDRQLGLDYYITTTTGLGGHLRERLDDFIVNEIPFETSHNADGEYTFFTLEKRDWETGSAIRAIARATGVSNTRFGYCGNKDMRALTTQRISAWRIHEERLRRIRISGIRLCDFSRSDFGLKTGDLRGNEFRIIIRRPITNGDALATVVRTACEQIVINGIPNYYGYQRFGTIRPNTQLVGRELVKGNLEGAVLEYLGRPFDTEPEDSKEARRYLDDTRDYPSALQQYPMRLTYERMLIAALASNPCDSVRALRRLPRGLRRLLVHAYQAYLFNRMLSRMLELEEDIRGRSLPVIGCRTTLSDGSMGDVQKAILDEEGVSPKNFHISTLPELSSGGTERPAFINVNPICKVGEDVQPDNHLTVTLGFALPSGSYATVVVREFMKSDPLHY